MAEPAMTYAIEPKSRADEDKLAPALHKVMEEDSMVRFFRDPQTNEFLVAGAGGQQNEAGVFPVGRGGDKAWTLQTRRRPLASMMFAPAVGSEGGIGQTEAR